MGSVNSSYDVALDIWLISYDPADNAPDTIPSDDASWSDGKPVPGTDFTTLLAPFDITVNGGIGLIFTLADSTNLYFLSRSSEVADVPNIWNVYATQVTLRGIGTAGSLDLSYSLDNTSWIPVATVPLASVVSEVGIVLWYDSPDLPVTGRASKARLWAGGYDDGTTEIVVPHAPPPSPGPMLATVQANDEPMVHVIVGAQFGDLEYDVGKSVRWLTWFTNNLFVLDVNLGTPRYWIVNWTETFPTAEHWVTGINWFVDPVAFRKEQWTRFQKAFKFTPEDWVLWIDAHEGFSVDNTTLPNDYDFAPFQSFIWREISRAVAAGQTSVVLPLFIFLRSDEIQNITYDTQSNGDQTAPDAPPPVQQAVSTPFYLPYQGLRRLWKISALQAANFDWSQIDTVATPSAGVKAQIISYAYAHYTIPNITPPNENPDPLTEANDDGFRMRKLISQVRPAPGLPTAVWNPNDQPAGLAGPWCADIAINTNPDLAGTIVEDVGHTPTAAGTAGLRTPLYDTVFRINMRDGVWYEAGLSGNIPLVWDGTQWVSNYDPALWPDLGVKASTVD